MAGAQLRREAKEDRVRSDPARPGAGEGCGSDDVGLPERDDLGGGEVSRSERCYRIDRVKFHVATQDPANATGEVKRPTKGRVLRNPDAMR
jgi:hypothetical protein